MIGTNSWRTLLAHDDDDFSLVMPSQEEVVARERIVQSLGTVHDVAGDGSCFIYAVLLGMGRLEHSNGSVPSANDLAQQRLLRDNIAQWWIHHPGVVDVAMLYGDGYDMKRLRSATEFS